MWFLFTESDVTVGLFPGKVGVFMLVDMEFFINMNFTIFHGVDMICGGGQEIELVRDDEVAKVGKIIEHLNQSELGVAVEPGGWFIQQKNVRFHGQNGSQGDEFFFAAGKFESDAISKIGKTEAL